MEPANPPSAAPLLDKKKNWFEIVVTSTPVLLTVVATFLVGQSTSEMTRAQYYRSLAGQNQSKVADQWGFYQAKRIRGQILEGNSDLLRAQSATHFSRDTFTDAAQELLAEFKASRTKVAEIASKATTNSKTKALTGEFLAIASDLDGLIADAESAFSRAQAMIQIGTSGWKGEKRTLDRASVDAALEALQPSFVFSTTESKTPTTPETIKPAVTESDSRQQALLAEIVNEIKNRKQESELHARVLQLQDATLVSAIQEKDRLADEVFQRGKRIENVLEEFDLFVDRQVALTYTYQNIATRIKKALRQVEGVNGDALKDSTQVIGQIPMKMQAAYNAARHAYSARRYEDDARSNQDSAYLYEVRVYLNSARSDKHLYRSKMFLFAMLVAQAGVTIATLALAVKRRSIFWLLATLTGIIAIGFGLYVYLDLGSMIF